MCFTNEGGVLSNAEELSGIFVKSVAEGSTAAVDGRIQLNDHIIAVSLVYVQF